MTRLNTVIWLVTILGLAACSGPDPSSPESTSTPTLQQDETAPVATMEDPTAEMIEAAR